MIKHFFLMLGSLPNLEKILKNILLQIQVKIPWKLSKVKIYNFTKKINFLDILLEFSLNKFFNQ